MMARSGGGILLLAFVLFPAMLAADVFWRIGGWRGDDGISPSAEAWPGVESASAPFYREEVRVNGHPGVLAAWSSSAPFGELAAYLGRRFPGAAIQRVGRTLRLRERSSGATGTRWLIVDGGRGMSTIFRLTAPENAAELRPEWPPELAGTLPAGAVPVMVVAVPGSKTTYASFRGGDPGDARGELRRLSDALRARGWSAAGAEASSTIGGRGEIFIRSSPRQILWVGLDDSGNGVCCISEQEK